jgi:hypothetical protein
MRTAFIVLLLVSENVLRYHSCYLLKVPDQKLLSQRARRKAAESAEKTFGGMRF